MIYGKNLTARITEDDIDNTSNIEVIDLINLPLKVEESAKWFGLSTERLTKINKIGLIQCVSLFILFILININCMVK